MKPVRLALAITLILAALAAAGQQSTINQQAQNPPRHANDKIPAALAMQSPRALGQCTIQNNNTGTILRPDVNGVLPNNDALFKLLSAQSSCPQNALIFRDLVVKSGMKLQPAMVGNRGYNNPLPQGSFSFFEAITGSYGGQTLVPGDWFFGHFTAASIDNTALTAILSPQQAATPNNLLLETIVWDPVKQVFNFYEIRGNGEGGIWFYRGDSNDIVADIRNLDRNTDPGQPIFMGPITNGQATLPRLRCSGCHMNGGPIMKELKFPHDSWQTNERPLNLGALRIAPEFKSILENVVSATEFSQWIKAGDEKLLASGPYWGARSTLSLQEQLRPVFCEQEVNLDSDTQPLQLMDKPVSAQTILAPTGFFIDQRLAPGVDGVTINKGLYINTLNLFQSQFIDYQTSASFPLWVQPVNQIDADHAFETPVKSHSDMLVAQKMISTGLINEKFLYDVLAVDMTRPMFSDARCSLLSLVPNAAPTPNWQTQFQQNLTGSSSPAAKELLASMKDPTHTPDYYRQKGKALIAKIQGNAADPGAVNGYVRLLAQRRISVYQAQISQHPQGQIFEPSFRLIFPTMQLFMKDQSQIAYGGVQGQFWLNPGSGLVELSR
jgi:hypothetical protein